MSLFALIQGLTKGTSDYVRQQRERQRALEDQDFDFRMRMLENEANRPDFDSRHYERLLGEMQELSGNRVSRGTKTKGGKAGMMGEQEPLPHGPISQILAGAATSDPSQPFVATDHPANIPLRGMGQQQVGGPIDPFSVNGRPASGAPPSGAPAAPGGAAAASGGTPPPPPAAAGAPSRGPAGLEPPPGLQPQPESSLPQPPGGTAMLSAANATAAEAQNPVPAAGPARMAPPPNAGFQAPFEVGPAGQPGGLRFTPEQMSAKKANDAAMTQFGTKFGATSGGVAAIDQMLPDDPSLAPEQQTERAQIKQQLRAHLLGLPIRNAQLVSVVATDPDNPGQKVIISANYDPIRRTLTDHAGRTLTDAIKVSPGASTPGIYKNVAPNGDVTYDRVNKFPIAGQSDTAVSIPSTAQGRVQFAPPPINVGESQSPTTGETTRTYVPREIAGGGKKPAAGAAEPSASPVAAPKPFTAGGPDTGTTVERTPDGGMNVRRAPTAKFSDAQKMAIAGMDSAERFATEGIKFIEQNHLQGDNNPIDSRWNNFIYSTMQMDPGATEPLIQNVGITEPKAIIGQMGGQRGQYWGEMLAKHTAQASNTYALMYKKLQNMIHIGRGIKQDMNNAAMLVPTSSGPKNPHLKAPPAGGLIQVPYKGKTYSFPTQQAADSFKREMGIP